MLSIQVVILIVVQQECHCLQVMQEMVGCLRGWIFCQAIHGFEAKMAHFVSRRLLWEQRSVSVGPQPLLPGVSLKGRP